MKIIKQQLTKDILKNVRKIDKDFYHSNKLTLEWYLERYKPYHHGYFLYNNDQLVGYVITVPVTKNLYDTLINGVLIDDIDINPKMFIEESNYHYLVSIVLKKKYRHQGYAKAMFKKLMEENLPHLCSMIVSQEGYLLSCQFLKETYRVNEKIAIFQNI